MKRKVVAAIVVTVCVVMLVWFFLGSWLSQWIPWIPPSYPPTTPVAIHVEAYANLGASLGEIQLANILVEFVAKANDGTIYQDITVRTQSPTEPDVTALLHPSWTYNVTAWWDSPIHPDKYSYNVYILLTASTNSLVKVMQDFYTYDITSITFIN